MNLSCLCLVVGLGAGAATLRAETPKTFSVRDHGARGDRISNDRAAIQAAVDACEQAGGGTVLLPPGDYLSGTIRLAGGVTLELATAGNWRRPRKGLYFGGNRPDAPKVQQEYKQQSKIAFTRGQARRDA